MIVKVVLYSCCGIIFSRFNVLINFSQMGFSNSNDVTLQKAKHVHILTLFSHNWFPLWRKGLGITQSVRKDYYLLINEVIFMYHQDFPSLVNPEFSLMLRKLIDSLGDFPPPAPPPPNGRPSWQCSGDHRC